jgi:hypothetical protein
LSPVRIRRRDAWFAGVLADQYRWILYGARNRAGPDAAGFCGRSSYEQIARRLKCPSEIEKHSGQRVTRRAQWIRVFGVGARRSIKVLPILIENRRLDGCADGARPKRAGAHG